MACPTGIILHGKSKTSFHMLSKSASTFNFSGHANSHACLRVGVTAKIMCCERCLYLKPLGRQLSQVFDPLYKCLLTGRTAGMWSYSWADVPQCSSQRTHVIHFWHASLRPFIWALADMYPLYSTVKVCYTHIGSISTWPFKRNHQQCVDECFNIRRACNSQDGR